MVSGIIILDCGLNYFIIMNAPYKSNTFFPIPILGQATTIRSAVGYQVMWSTHLVCEYLFRDV